MYSILDSHKMVSYSLGKKYLNDNGYKQQLTQGHRR